MKEEFITDLKPGDIFKLNNTGIDVHRIVMGVTVEHCDYLPYTLVRVYYAFADEDFNDRVFRTMNTWTMMKKVYKVSI